MYKRQEFTFESGHESEFNRLHLVVFETFLCAAVHRLFAVEQVRRRIPDITHIVNAELISSVALRYQDIDVYKRQALDRIHNESKSVSKKVKL